MTTAAMVVGLVPLVIATGAGAASRFSIGIVVVSGMSIGTLFTLFVLPAVYTVLAKDHAAAEHSCGRASWRKSRRADDPAESRGNPPTQLIDALRSALIMWRNALRFSALLPADGPCRAGHGPRPQPSIRCGRASWRKSPERF